MTATPGGRQVWAAGEADRTARRRQAAVAHFAGSRWRTLHRRRSRDGANWYNLYGVASGGSVYVAGTCVEPGYRQQRRPAAEGHDRRLLVRAGAPRPGLRRRNIPGGIANIAGELWLAGIYNTDSSNLRLNIADPAPAGPFYSERHRP